MKALIATLAFSTLLFAQDAEPTPVATGETAAPQVVLKAKACAPTVQSPAPGVDPNHARASRTTGNEIAGLSTYLFPTKDTVNVRFCNSTGEELDLRQESIVVKWAVYPVGVRNQKP